MANIKSIINMHNKERITEKKTEAVKCNCMNKPDCPLSNQCQITNIIYQAKLTSNLWNYHKKIYYGTNEGTFKQRYGNHKKSFNLEKLRTDTELSKEYCRLKELKAKPQVQFCILKRCWLTKRTCICYLCLNKRLFIIEHQGNNLLNQRNELISKCRHKKKLTLWTTKPDHCLESVRVQNFFLVQFFPAFGLNMKTSCILSECGIMWARPTLNVNTIHAVDVRTLLRYFNTIVLLAEWLWRHCSSYSCCFVSLIQEYDRSTGIYWALSSEEVDYIFCYIYIYTYIYITYIKYNIYI